MVEAIQITEVTFITLPRPPVHRSLLVISNAFAFYPKQVSLMHLFDAVTIGRLSR